MKLIRTVLFVDGPSIFCTLVEVLFFIDVQQVTLKLYWKWVLIQTSFSRNVADFNTEIKTSKHTYQERSTLGRKPFFARAHRKGR